MNIPQQILYTKHNIDDNNFIFWILHGWETREEIFCSSKYNTKIPPVFPHILQQTYILYQIENDEKNVGILDKLQPKEIHYWEGKNKKGLRRINKSKMKIRIWILYLLIVERIWATGHSSFAFIKALLSCVVGGSETKSPSSTEVLIE